MLIFLKKMDDFIRYILKILLVLIFFIMTSVALIQVFYRFILNNPLTWTDEVCRYCLIWITLIGIGVAAERKSHISINLICSFLSPKVLLVLEKFWNICSIFFCVVLIKYGVVLANLNMVQFSAGMHISLGYMNYAIPLGGIIVVYYNLIQLFGLDKKFATITSKKEER